MVSPPELPYLLSSIKFIITKPQSKDSTGVSPVQAQAKDSWLILASPENERLGEGGF
jgi:hypothetical protein